MMTTAVTVPRLDIPPQEDVMELSPDSDQHPGKDGDTDIEIDFAEDQTQDQDNDYIIEDARSEGGVGAQEFPVETGNDDVMLDEEGSQGDLHDDTLPEDEDLDDAGDYIQYDANQKPSTLYEDASYHSGSMLKRTDETELPATEEVHSDHHDDVEAAIAEGSNHQNIKIEQLEAPSSHEVREDAEPLKEASPNPDTDLAAGSNLEDLRDPLDWSGTSTRKSEFDPVAPNKEHNDEAQAGAVTSKLGGPRSDPISTQNDFTDGTTSVHPVVVVYQDSEISLFPPSNQSDSSTFFLHDENLASSNISDLLLACKSVLADSISEEDELELSIEELGLCISEDSKSASHTTLSQILKVYLQLLHLDGVSDPGPLYMILSVKTSFCKRLRGLINAANEGKGISQLPYWETLSDDDAATAADGDVAYDTAEEPTEEAEDKTSADAEDHHLQQSELRVSNNGVVVLQDDRAVSEPYQIPASSQISKAASSPATLDRYENSNPSGMSANTVSGEHGQKTQTRISPPKDSLETRSPKDDIISTELPPPEEGKDGDLIDYEDGDDPLIQTSTGSSTLAGDDPAPAATAEQEPNTDYNLELIPHTVAVTSTTATNVRPGTAEIFFGAEGLQGHGEDMSSKTHDLQQEYYHADGSENYGDSNGRVTFQLGSDDAGAELFKHIAHSPHSLDVEESLAGALDFDDETYGHESAGIPKIAKLDPRVIGDAHQDLLDQLPEDASDDHDESIHGVEIIHDYSEADGTGLSDHVGDNTATIEDLNAKAVTLGSTVDTDEINYEEDEPVDVASEQGRESTLGSKLLTTPRASSTKRLRGENAEVGALDDDSQDAKRVRSA